MASDLDTPHPFCRKELLTDGKTIFMRNTEEAAAGCLAEVLTGQRVFPEILLPFLKRIDYDKVRLLALRWHIADATAVCRSVSHGWSTPTKATTRSGDLLTARGEPAGN